MLTCVEQISPIVGISYIGHKLRLMVLLNFLEDRMKVTLDGPSHSVTKGNREIKNLECAINYCGRGGCASCGERKERGNQLEL